MSFTRMLLAAAIFGVALTSQALAGSKMLDGPRGDDATIVVITGVTSDKALVRFCGELDDEVEDRVRVKLGRQPNIRPLPYGSLSGKVVAERPSGDPCIQGQYDAVAAL